MKKFLVSLMKDESGLTTVEYAVGAAVIVAGSIGAFELLGGAVEDRIRELADLIAPAA